VGLLVALVPFHWAMLLTETLPAVKKKPKEVSHKYKEH
jgi:hypothetical protein